MSRDASTLLLVHDAQQIHAGVGIQDPFTRPDVSLDARVGRRSDGYLVGDALAQAEAAGESLAVTYPIENGEVQDWAALEALWYVAHAHPS